MQYCQQLHEYIYDSIGYCLHIVKIYLEIVIKWNKSRILEHCMNENKISLQNRFVKGIELNIIEIMGLGISLHVKIDFLTYSIISSSICSL